MNAPNMKRLGVWRKLLPPALTLMAHLEKELRAPLWTFGGGTVLMLRLGHRQSKDIDLFVPDPQYLGYVSPRLSDAAEAVSANYEENAEYIKFFLPEGEIDIVVGTALTPEPFDLVAYAGHNIKIETCAEIIAKKMWHRGDQAKARDLFDLCAVADAEPMAIAQAAPFFTRHGKLFLERLHARATIARSEFDAIDRMDFKRSFDDCLDQAHGIVEKLLSRSG